MPTSRRPIRAEKKTTTTSPVVKPAEQHFSSSTAAPQGSESTQFKPGCKGGPGNPFAKRVAALRKSLLESVSEADVAQLGRKLLEQALGGDVAASKVLLAYVVGKPTETIDPDRLALEAWRLIQSWPTAAEVLATTWGVEPQAAAILITQMAPASPEVILQHAASPTPIEGADRIRTRRETKGK
ncbi:MAG TPA: hypothetical protein VHR66_26470 [Gemmataceae bacterium]|nr:hypothetical protein [Gemmataceae bacterium]